MKLNDCKFEYEYENSKYSFLNVPTTKYKKTHYEVSSYSINIIYEHFKYFDVRSYKENNFSFICEQPKRRLITSSGAYIQAPDGKIDIVADILTTAKRSNFKEFFKENNEATHKFNKIYHSIGNIIPFPEGANAGQIGQDDYFDKLTYMKNQIDILCDNKKIINDEEICAVKTRLDENISFGSIKKRAYINQKDLYKKILFKNNIVKRYWLQFNGDKGLNWKKYVEYNHLQDFVDNKNEIIKAKSVEELTNMIIKRGYRILNNGNTISNDELQNAYNSIENN